MGARRYTPAEIEKGLCAVALCGDSAYKAHNEGHTTIPFPTLDTWMRADPERYQRIQAQMRPLREKYIASEAESLAIAIGAVERKLVESLTDEKIEQMKGKELGNTLKALTTSKALQMDKVQGPLFGRPTVVEHRHSAGDLLDKLAARIGTVIDSTAEPIEDVKELPA